MLNVFRRNFFLRNYFFERSGVDQVLMLSCLFSLALVSARYIYTGERIFLFLPWNLFLAFLPYMVSRRLAANPAWMGSRVKFLFAFIVWLLFIPNSFYIITDLFHLGKSDEMPLWYDLSLIFSFAWNGLLTGILSVRQVERIIQKTFPRVSGVWFVIPVMGLNAFGIYIGRYLRFNSWDVLVNPFGLAGEILYLIIHPLRNMKDWAMIFCFTLLMVLIYESLKKVSRTFQ
jgi:uncharacterized membrane protein